MKINKKRSDSRWVSTNSYSLKDRTLLVKILYESYCVLNDKDYTDGKDFIWPEDYKKMHEKSLKDFDILIKDKGGINQ